ncbi:MAG TPA: SH3 domain-containing protein, partial [Devosia sp.]
TAPAPTGDIRQITAGVLNMRSEPNKYSDLIVSLPRGTKVSVSDTSGSWAYVTTTDGTSGWLSQNFLAPVDE